MSDGIFTFFDKATVESMFKRVANGPLALLLPCLQTIRVSDRDSRTVIGRIRDVTSPV